MIFKEKAKKVNYVRYTPDRTNLTRRITFKRPLAEETNKLIAVFNKESEIVKLNNSLLVAIAFKCFFNQLETLKEEDVIYFLEKQALEEGARKNNNLQTKLTV